MDYINTEEELVDIDLEERLEYLLKKEKRDTEAHLDSRFD